MSEKHITYTCNPIHTTVTAANTEESRRMSLGVVLDYAYRGIAAQGASCHLAQWREEDCPLCDSLADVERMVRVEAPTENWWRGGHIERFVRRLLREVV